MKRIFATFLKEWHLLRRDLGGLALLFFMPILLIVIMALVQDGPFKDYKNVKFEALLINEDQGRVANSLKEGLVESRQFDIIEKYKGVLLSKQASQNLIQTGKYKFAIIIPKGITAEIVNSANSIANEMGKQMGLPSTFPYREARAETMVQVMFDPVSKPAFKLAILNAIERLTTKIQSEIILERISKLNPQSHQDTTFDLEKKLRSVSVKEISTSDKKEELVKTNSVQHNVPAWAIFGMFFMVILIAESVISERMAGSWTRIKLIPGSFSHILIGKMLFFITLGNVQFYAMLLVGVFFMPLIGLPSLQMNGGLLPLFLMVTAISSCATSFGILIGTLFSTSNQALPVAAISVVILSAIGGVWVPIEILPPILKYCSVISPMR
ncbi:MAG: ABC transporter permease [Chitinophagaceae bacterium]|nr:ABC transporter permease [Chitinophagaceae bacterium]